MTETGIPASQQDEAAVAAVRQGDAERYRELVERHERSVYAVAWSRLGDATLAEEATQEAFVRAYRRLWLLGDGAKFAGWIGMIARRVAINFGVMRRRELNKRERWALEQAEPADVEPGGEEGGDLCAPETLRRTLAELPPAHRECLVLFYLEGRSGAEAAEALGISESALRVRLHRARAALRARLEEQLEGSLARLKPTRSVVSAVMAAVLASSSAKAATAGGVGATLVGALTKMAPVKWVVGLFPLLFALPLMLVSWLNYKSELDNFRDANGFRARLFRQGAQGRIVWVAVALVIFMVFLPAQRAGAANLYLLLACFMASTWPAVWGQWRVNRSRFFLVTALSSVTYAVTFTLLWLGVISFSTLVPILVTQSLLTVLCSGARPTRMDYNLFLRASEGLLTSRAEDGARAAGARLSKSELLAFARFLGTRWLVDASRWTADGLRLRLPACNISMLWSLWPYGQWGRRSQLVLGWDGGVTARLNPGENSILAEVGGKGVVNPDELEEKVEAAVAVAWRHFRAGNVSRAEAAIGQVPDEQVFRKAPAKTGVMRWQKVFNIVWLTAFGVLMVMKYFHPLALSQLQRVQATEAEVRAFLNDTTPNPDPRRFKANSPWRALFECMVLPSTNLYSPDAMRWLRDEVVEGEGFAALRGNPSLPNRVLGTPLLRRAVAGGWISWADLGVDPKTAGDKMRPGEIHLSNRWEWTNLLTRLSAWSWVSQHRFEVMRMQADGLSQLRVMRDLNCLELVDGDALGKKIAEAQVLSGNPPGQPPMHDWKDVRGLFFTPCFPALQDTYYSLAALELLGGLGRIDREACIQGILRRHHGGGRFSSPDTGGYNEYHIDGSARDTIAAYESLRILKALDRVKNLDRWEFLVNDRHVSKLDAQERRTLNWEEVEAWVAGERFRQILKVNTAGKESGYSSLVETR